MPDSPHSDDAKGRAVTSARTLEDAVKRAAAVLRQGGIIAYPTEAVWGLGADPANYAACQRLLQIKGRPPEKGMILVASTAEQFSSLLAPLGQQQREQLDAGWAAQAINGPLTYLVPDLSSQVPSWIKGDHPAVALRVSDHFVVKELCNAFGGPVVSTSANRAGLPPARSESEVQLHLGAHIDYILSGPLGEALHPSRIVDLVTGQEIRPG